MITTVVLTDYVCVCVCVCDQSHPKKILTFFFLSENRYLDSA